MFLDPRTFDFVADLESEWTAIRDECLALPDDAYEPWIQREMYGHGWNVYGLVAIGTRIEPALAKCPATAQAIARVPGLTTALFSRLEPGAHIEPHVGWVTTVYRAHLGLVAPKGCMLRVGNDTRAWREGQTLIFDDTVQHEAWNWSKEPRIVLLFDFVRPGFEGVPQDVPPPKVRALIRRWAR